MPMATMKPTIRWLTIIVLSAMTSSSIYALHVPTDRRDFITTSIAASYISSAPSLPAYAIDVTDDISPLLDAKTMYWNGPAWSKARYRASTLQSSADYQNVPEVCQPAFYPAWLEGYYTIEYKFNGASFPQGKNILSLRTAGAGLGTCLSLPNVGYNPPVHPVHFIKDISRDAVYEDLAYNFPRKFEAFWPEAKVLGIQTNGDRDEVSKSLGMKCLVSGDGCTLHENPNLHMPASRVSFDFDAPTRRSGRLTQTTDVAMLDCSIQSAGNVCYTAKSFSQYNINQDLQTFYREITSWQRVDNAMLCKIRVAAFLPKYKQEVGASSAGDEYDDNEAVAIYDYKVKLKSIDEMEAASL